VGRVVKSRSLMIAGAALQTRLCDVVGCLSTACDCFAHGLDVRRHRRGFGKFSEYDLRVVQAVAGTSANNGRVLWNQIAPLFARKFEQSGNGSSARRLNENSFCLREP